MKKVSFAAICIAIGMSTTGCIQSEADLGAECLDRFSERVANAPELDATRTFFTYDISDSDLSVDGFSIPSNASITSVNGRSNDAAATFLENGGRTGPAIFLSDDASYFRTAPVVGLPTETIIEACRAPIKGGRLIRIDWFASAASKETAQ